MLDEFHSIYTGTIKFMNFELVFPSSSLTNFNLKYNELRSWGGFFWNYPTSLKTHKNRSRFTVKLDVEPKTAPITTEDVARLSSEDIDQKSVL